MYRQNQSIYCKTPEIAEKVRAYAKQLNQESQDCEIPKWIMDILQGGAVPNPEECTREEAAILYDREINPLIIAYRMTRQSAILKEIEKKLKNRKIYKI